MAKTTQIKPLVDIFFPITVRSKQRPRFFKGHVYTPKETRDYEKELEGMALIWVETTKHKIIDFPMEVHLHFCFKRPKKPKFKQHGIKPDLDNIIKCMDSFNEVLWTDDSLICKIYAAKHYVDFENEAGFNLTIFPANED
jgi:Holliday junction resolvase RusA-like endonuclease